MRVAINVIPLNSAHKERGIGHYTHNLIESLKHNQTVQIYPFTNIQNIKDVDVVHYPWFDLFFHTLPIIKKFPTVVTIHDVIPLIFNDKYPVGLKGKTNFLLQKIALRNCKAFITDSEASKKDIVRLLKINQEQIKVIPLAADESFKPLSENKKLFIKRKYSLPDKFLLYTGDANWFKNLPFLIEGFSILKRQPSFSDIKLVLVGGVFLKKINNTDHPELRSLKMVSELIHDKGLEKDIYRPGQVNLESLVGIYNLASVYIQPSFYEGFGLPVLEALNCGTPVVCSKGGSLPEIGGDAVIYFDPQNLNQMVGILCDVLKDRSLRTRLSKLGLQQTSKFTWEKTAAETIKAYQSAVK